MGTLAGDGPRRQRSATTEWVWCTVVLIAMFMAGAFIVGLCSVIGLIVSRNSGDRAHTVFSGVLLTIRVIVFGFSCYIISTLPPDLGGG
jgi:hypothetical protein